MVWWCIRLTRLTLVSEVIQLRLLQVRKTLTKSLNERKAKRFGWGEKRGDCTEYNVVCEKSWQTLAAESRVGKDEQCCYTRF